VFKQFFCKFKTKIRAVGCMKPENYDFNHRVFDVVRLIPPGRVTTYGAIAAFLGSKRSSRMVGWAMNLSHAIDPKIPAHRVVNRQGLLTGKMHFSHPDRMQELLEAEGVIVCNDQIQNFNDVFWVPEIPL
jgi:methylated-DNA-protein-cysteine methyltransferase-like protein